MDQCGNWSLAEIKCHKKRGDPLPRMNCFEIKQHQKEMLEQYEKETIERLSNLEAIYVHFPGYPEEWDEWIFIDPKYTVCCCQSGCTIATNTSDLYHRVAAPYSQINTQDVIYSED